MADWKASADQVEQWLRAQVPGGDVQSGYLFDRELVLPISIYQREDCKWCDDIRKWRKN